MKRMHTNAHNLSICKENYNFGTLGSSSGKLLNILSYH